MLVALAVLTACGSKAATAVDKIELGQKYLTELNYTEAVASFTEAIKLDPDNIQAYMGCAEAYMALGEYDKALADYWWIREVQPENKKARSAFCSERTASERAMYGEKCFARFREGM